MTKNKYHTVLRGMTILACAVTMLTVFLPVMGGESSREGVAEHIVLSGMNLIEFSGYGYAFFIAPLILMAIGCLIKCPRHRMAALLATCTGYIACYVMNVSAGWQWLLSHDSLVSITGANISVYAGVWLIPAMFLIQAAVTAADVLLEKRSDGETAEEANDCE